MSDIPVGNIPVGDILAPAEEASVARVVAEAHAAGEPLLVEGGGTKRAALRPVQAARSLSLRNLSGITFYRPQEMVISARAGTPIPEIEAALAERGQQLIAEPPDPRPIFGGEAAATLGGTVAANLSGPRRINGGAMRDHVLGVRFVNGEGEVLRSGGRVLKNVTGLDLCKLLSGSHGTLGVMTEITLKVLPASEATATLAVRVPDLRHGVGALAAALGSPFGVSAAAILPEGHAALGLDGVLAVARLEDFSESVRYRAERLREALGLYGALTLIEGEDSRALWRAVRDAVPLGAAPEEAVWRVSLRPSAAPGVAEALRREFGARLLLDWGGGLVWVAGPASEAAHAAVMRAALSAGGTFLLFRGPEPLRAAVPVIPEEVPALAALSQRVKAALDPRGILNPGRLRAA
ncbi:FAD-binding protein [Roseomonas gilardii]|uniref:FAD-binding protein n=1 Tax=Roseomonas gilardii TaxID=257708 RepID=A0ABU3MEI1_9PROT|nr:FAD-binding protein [Roseomonas gilardii]MDT8331227.1 FAD-binding protein [Roseomonas gilardii]